MDVPGAARLAALTEATFFSNDELDAHSSWLRVLVDTLAMDPGQLHHPCQHDHLDDRMYTTPFMRLSDGYRLVLPLDLAITIRVRLLRSFEQEGLLRELAKRWRQVVSRRVIRMLPSNTDVVELENSASWTRYLVKIDDYRDLHLLVATDRSLTGMTTFGDGRKRTRSSAGLLDLWSLSCDGVTPRRTTWCT